MKRHDGISSDAMVDLYRAILATSAAIGDAEKRLASTPGAGVDARKVIRPSKRLRNWHRASDAAVSLKKYARTLATTSGDNKATAQRWLDSKSVRP